MYCLTVIETFIKQRWLSEQYDVRYNFNNTLWEYLMKFNFKLSNPIRNKLCQVITSLAYYDPNLHLNFMVKLLELINSEYSEDDDTKNMPILLGVKVLGVALEMTSSNNSFNNNSVHVEFGKFLFSNMPTIIESLASLIASVSEIDDSLGTPPPSPTNAQNKPLHSNSSNFF